MPSPLEGLFDRPAGTVEIPTAAAAPPLTAVLDAVQRHGGLPGVLRQLERAGAGEVVQSLLAGGPAGDAAGGKPPAYGKP